METPTELLMKCMEDFGESEGTVAIVVYRQQDGNISFRASENANTSEIVGMLDCAHALVLHTFINQAKAD